jgi:lipoic acid synthetase
MTSATTRAVLRRQGLHTVCEEAACPNRNQCYARRTATFLLLGDRCTRDCRFCNIRPATDRPSLPDPGEPARVAAAAAELGLTFVVLTSVTRDDLPDGGAAHFAATIQAVRGRLPGCRVEVLTPDFNGDEGALATVLAAAPDVFNHNLETVPRRYPAVRPQADYARSLALLRRAAELAPATITKSGLMVGLGETDDEIHAVLADLRAHAVTVATIGQYLPPSAAHLPIDRFVTPTQFERYRAWGQELGFLAVAAGPYVRSSYFADEVYAGGVAAAPSSG